MVRGFRYRTTSVIADTDVGDIAIYANGVRLVWASHGSPPSYSTNNGATWNLCGGNLMPSISWELPLLFSDRVNSNKFYLYMPSTGVVHLSTDGGANFVAGPTISTWCETMRTVYGYEGHVWIASTDGNSSNAGRWRSTNSGASFTKIGGIQNAKSIGFGRTASGGGHPVLYMNGQINNTLGVIRSENLGVNWTRINDDQHQYGSIAATGGTVQITDPGGTGHARRFYRIVVGWRVVPSSRLLILLPAVTRKGLFAAMKQENQAAERPRLLDCREIPPTASLP